MLNLAKKCTDSYIRSIQLTDSKIKDEAPFLFNENKPYTEKIKMFSNSCKCTVPMPECTYNRYRIAINLHNKEEAYAYRNIEQNQLCIIKELGYYPLICTCYNCNALISFHKMIHHKIENEQYINNKLYNHILSYSINPLTSNKINKKVKLQYINDIF